MIALKNIRTATSALVTLPIIQAAVLILSLDGYYEISVFCTGPQFSVLSPFFGLPHILFLGLLALGLASLIWRATRPVYFVLAVVGSAALPVQAMLVHKHVLTCDAL